MVTNRIDAGMLQKMFLAGAKTLEIKKEWINSFNSKRRRTNNQMYLGAGIYGD